MSPLCELPAHTVPATLQSWTVPYRGNIAKLVYEYVKSHNNPDLYVCILAIVQSSGMEKSRMIDELSKKHFVIPLNFHNGESGRVFRHLISKLKPLTSNLKAIQLPTPKSATGLKYLVLVLPKVIIAAVLSSPHWSRRRWTLLKTRNSKFTMLSWNRPTLEIKRKQLLRKTIPAPFRNNSGFS
jgi:hypothetical protein